MWMAWFSLRFPRSDSRCRLLPPEDPALLLPYDGIQNPEGVKYENTAQRSVNRNGFVLLRLWSRKPAYL